MIGIIKIGQDLRSEEELNGKELVLGEIEPNNITVVGQIDAF